MSDTYGPDREIHYVFNQGITEHCLPIDPIPKMPLESALIWAYPYEAPDALFETTVALAKHLTTLDDATRVAVILETLLSEYRVYGEVRTVID